LGLAQVGADGGGADDLDLAAGGRRGGAAVHRGAEGCARGEQHDDRDGAARRPVHAVTVRACVSLMGGVYSSSTSSSQPRRRRTRPVWASSTASRSVLLRATSTAT